MAHEPQPAAKPPADALVRVAAAVILRAGRVLLARRPEGSHLARLWEFPGGKIEPGETLEGCLRREIEEELGTAVEIGAHWMTVRHAYPEREVEIAFYICSLAGPEPRPLACDELAWVSGAELAAYELPPADRAVVAGLPALLGA